MTTPERPSLADTLARIDAVLDAYYDPTTDTTEVDVVTRITSIVDHAAKPCLRCARQALRGSEFCAAHKRIPREMIEELGSDGVDDEATAEVLRIVQDDFARHEREYLRGLPLDVRPRGGITENGKVLPWSPYLQPALEEAARQSAARLAAVEPAPPDPDWITFEPLSKPGWLARALRRLFT